MGVGGVANRLRAWVSDWGSPKLNEDEKENIKDLKLYLTENSLQSAEVLAL